jgi:hypothetical protein
MRHAVILAAGLAGVFALSACNQRTSDAEVQRALKSVNVIDESNLSEIMLTVGDPGEAVAYFSKASAENPDRAGEIAGPGQPADQGHRGLDRDRRHARLDQ